MSRRLPRQKSDQMFGVDLGASLTIHNHFHIVHKPVDHLQDVRLRHACLVLGEPVQSTQNIFDLFVAQQFLCELLCN